jgi:protein-L-isoaspartate(D-aspartate) O-methyltransferase
MELAEIRGRFAKNMAAKAGLSEDSAIARAFALISREEFVGPPPWRTFGEQEDTEAMSDDPAALYRDVLVQLKSAGAINNGQPSLHALCFGALDVKEGQTVVHIGTGTGYYTAILGELTGSTGIVEGYEIEQDLAESAMQNLRTRTWVRIHAASGTKAPLPECDVLYVSAGATTPLSVWLDALRTGGRLLFPLTPDEGYGGMLLVTRQAEGYAARFVSGAKFVGCTGARTALDEARIAECFRKGGTRRVQSLHRNDSPNETAWCAGIGWWLSTAA